MLIRRHVLSLSLTSEGSKYDKKIVTVTLIVAILPQLRLFFNLEKSK